MTDNPSNYIPSPIEMLTTATVDQQILATLQRIEVLLTNHFTPVALVGIQATQESPQVSTRTSTTKTTRGSRK